MAKLKWARRTYFYGPYDGKSFLYWFLDDDTSWVVLRMGKGKYFVTNNLSLATCEGPTNYKNYQCLGPITTLRAAKTAYQLIASEENPL